MGRATAATRLVLAHNEGIVHRDLKPQNIVLTEAGIKLLDFGLAAFIEPAVTSADGTRRTRRVLVGSAQYMAPEQVRGEPVDARSDLFSAGVVLQQMLTGVRPFDRPTLLATLYAILHEPPAPMHEGVPAVARAIVERCLEKQPERRFRSAEVLGAALRSACEAMRTDTASVASPRARQSVSTRRWWAAAVVGLSLAFATAWSMRKPSVPTVTGYRQITNDGQQKSAVVTDGSRLYISELLNNTPVLVHAPVTGGTPSPIPLPFSNPALDDISIANAELFVGSYIDAYPFQYWAVPIAGGSPRRLPVRAHDVPPSPDGRQIAYVVGSDISVSQRDG